METVRSGVGWGVWGWQGQLGQGHRSNVGTQASDERQHRAASVGLGFGYGGSAHLPACCGSLATPSPGLLAGVAQRALQDTLPCCALGWQHRAPAFGHLPSGSSRLQGRTEQAVCLPGAVVVLPSLPSSPPLPVPWRLLLSSLFIWGGRVTSDSICPFPIAGLALGHGEVGERLSSLCNSLLTALAWQTVSCLLQRAGNTRAVFPDHVSCSGLSLGLPWCCCHSTRPAGAM